MAIDWDAVRDEVTGHLQALLRIETVNPPGNETRAAEYLAGVAREAGIPFEIAEGEPGRGTFVARRPGHGAARPDLLPGATHPLRVGGLGHPTAPGPLVGDLTDYSLRPRSLFVPEWTDSTDWAFMVGPELHRTLVMAYQQGGRQHPLPAIWFAADPTSGLLFT